MERPSPIDATGVTLRSADRRSPATTPATAEPRSLGEVLTQAALGRGAATRPADDEELAPGSAITRYRIVTRLGAGGMGVVYRAHDAQLDRDVALKVMRVGEGSSDSHARMLREARAAAKIRHPNVVTVYDADMAMDRVFIAMELIDGVTLKAYFRGRERAWREVVSVLLGAGEGLAAAHAAGLVHRDFKPDNVLVEAGGRVRVLDFGLARPAYDVEGPTLRAGESSGATTENGAPVMRTLTQTGTVVGTPAYMAPEQHRGAAVDARTDQFSFCVTLYECLFKSRPFAGDTQSELTLNVLEGRLVLPADRGDVPQELIAALQRGLAVEPAQRHPSLADLLADLRGILRKHEPRERRGGLIAAVAAVVCVGVAVAVALTQGEASTAEVVRTEPAPVVVAEPEPEPLAKEPPAKEQPVARRPAQVTIAAPAGTDAAALAGLLRQLLPQGTAAEAVPEGVALVGPKATEWRDAARMLALEAGRRPAKPTGGVVAQVPTPSGLVPVYSVAASELAGRGQAIAKLPGIHAVATSEALQLLLVIGTPAGLQAAERVGREGGKASRTTPKEWCVRIHNEADLGGEERCHATRTACEADAASWLGEAKTKRCYGKS